MFCKNCGTQLKEGAKFCPKCGTPVTPMPGAGQAGPGAGPQPPYQQPGGGQPPHQGPAAGKASKIPIFAIGAIVILVVAVILIFRACAGGGYEKPIKNFMQGMEDLDADKMLSAFPPEALEALEDEGYDEDEISEQFEQMVTAGMDSLGFDIDYAIDYEIEDATELSKREISDIEEAFEDEDIDLSIKEGRSVDLTLTISLDSLGISQDEEITLEAIKVGGGWYLNPLSMDF